MPHTKSSLGEGGWQGTTAITDTKAWHKRAMNRQRTVKVSRTAQKRQNLGVLWAGQRMGRSQPLAPPGKRSKMSPMCPGNNMALKQLGNGRWHKLILPRASVYAAGQTHRGKQTSNWHMQRSDSWLGHNDNQEVQSSFVICSQQTKRIIQAPWFGKPKRNQATRRERF